jgi:hypothetical protein
LCSPVELFSTGTSPGHGAGGGGGGGALGGDLSSRSISSTSSALALSISLKRCRCFLPPVDVTCAGVDPRAAFTSAARGGISGMGGGGMCDMTRRSPCGWKHMHISGFRRTGCWQVRTHLGMKGDEGAEPVRVLLRCAVAAAGRSIRRSSLPPFSTTIITNTTIIRAYTIVKLITNCDSHVSHTSKNIPW